MALPLLGVGAALLVAYAGRKMSEQHQKRQGRVGAFPGELKDTIAPINGSILTCGVFGIFDHSGIWCDGYVVELKGNGLVRAVTPERFLSERSGNTIYVAGDELGNPLGSNATMQRATKQIYQYFPYDVIKFNCHRFVWHCISGEEQKVTRFTELNEQLANHYCSPIYWRPLA